MSAVDPIQSIREVAMAFLDSFTNWMRGLVSPARTTSQMLADMESDDLIGTERRRGQPALGPLPSTHAPGRQLGALPRDERGE
jgi:hypothetical protein